MDHGWVTVLLLAFGMAVGIIGVIAFLRMFRKDKAAYGSTRPDAPPVNARSSEQATDSEHKFIKD